MTTDNRIEWLQWYCYSKMRLCPCWEIGIDGVCACGGDCEPRSWGKHPRLHNWPEVASYDWGVVESWHATWPTCNWAWVLDEHFVLDDDPRNGGFDPEGFFQEWESKLGFGLPRTLVQLTGGGGLHVVYKQPALGEVGSGKLWHHGRRLNGLEIKGCKAEKRGYVLVQPSNHKSGGIYKWGQWTEPVDPPGELLALRTRANGDSPVVGGLTDSGEEFEVFDWGEALTLGAIQSGEQQDVLYRAACSLRARKETDSLALPLLQQVVENFTLGRADEPWTETHVIDMWERVKREFAEGYTGNGALPDYRPEVPALRLIVNNSTAEATEVIEEVETRSGEPDSDGGSGGGEIYVLDGGGNDNIDFGGPNSDRNNAELFVQMFGNRILWTPGRGWWLWDGRKWCIDDLGVIKALCASAGESLRLRTASVDDDERELLIARAHRMSMTHGILATLSYAETLVGKKDHELDQHSTLINMPNGVLDLMSGEIRSHSPELLLTRMTGFEWTGEDVESPLLDEYHSTFLPDPEIRRGLYRLLGLCMLGGNPERMALMLIGDTTSGKSQLASGLERALGDYVGIGSASIFRGHLDDRARPDILNLLTSRMVLLEEASRNWEIHTDRLKHMTGGGDVTVRGMHSNTFVTRVPEFTPVFIANEMPRMKGGSNDNALRQRLRVVRFGHRPALVDSRKKIDFLADETCMTALLDYLVHGCLEGVEMRLEELPAVFDLTAMKVFDDLDDVVEFMGYVQSEGVMVQDGELARRNCVRVSDLHKVYTKWVKQHGDDVQWRDRFGLKGFNQRLTALGYEVVRANGTRIVGWKLSEGLTYDPGGF